MTHSFPTRRAADLEFERAQPHQRHQIFLDVRPAPDVRHRSNVLERQVVRAARWRPGLSEVPRLLIGQVPLGADPEMLFRRFDVRSEEHTSELQSLMRISYAVFCLKKKKKKK